jgi:demethylmenaquinone methyltransferase/2-methoxy-6-polyprenyl-1,4-benzoquinol methylase
MFDVVSGRYDLLNRVMSLGQDGGWRAAMWRGVREDARTVLDLCTGSGASLPGLRRPGRLVLGADVSLRMLELAASRQGRAGWAPRLLCTDGFRLPLRDHSLDAVTVAFGMRNLRPTEDALTEIARVLRPRGALVVLEATAPAPGLWAPVHRFCVRRLVPLVGRLSDDPSAYRYLSRSIFEFGSGPEFERALASAGFRVVDCRRFLLGAARLWVAERILTDGQIPAHPDWPVVQIAGLAGLAGGKTPNRIPARTMEWRVWTGVQLALSLSITAALAYGLFLVVKFGADLPLADWQRSLAWLLMGGGLPVFIVRSLILLRRFLGPPGRL